jgi:predicted PurR-regulated permease PerM
MPDRRLPYLLFVGIAAVLVGIVIHPLWKPLFLGGVLATALSRPHEQLTRFLRGHRGVAASIITFVSVIMLLGPVASVVIIAARQAFDALVALRSLLANDGLARLIAKLPGPLVDLVNRIREVVPGAGPGELAGELPEKLLQGSGWAASVAGGAVRMTSQVAFDVGIMLLTMHVLLLDGRRLVVWLMEVSPLERVETQTLLVEFKKATRAILTSTLATASVQGLVSMIGYVIAGAPRPIFFGIVTFLCAFIPGVGTGLVALPMTAWLFFSGHHGAAVFLLVYFVLVISMVDNLLKPLLMKSGMRMHGAIVFLSLVGGILSMGGVGLVAGPLVLTFFLAMVRLRNPPAQPPDFSLPGA